MGRTVLEIKEIYMWKLRTFQIVTQNIPLTEYIIQYYIYIMQREKNLDKYYISHFCFKKYLFCLQDN